MVLDGIFFKDVHFVKYWKRNLFARNTYITMNVKEGSYPLGNPLKSFSFYTRRLRTTMSTFFQIQLSPDSQKKSRVCGCRVAEN